MWDFKTNMYKTKNMQPDTYYHIYNRANGSVNLFRNDENYRYFLQQWVKYTEPIAETYVYCLMPNHFHVLIKIKNDDTLTEFFKNRNKDLTGFENLSGLVSQQFSNFFNSYAKAYNKMFGRNGSLFNRPFKAKSITSDSYLTNVIFYIHHNPVHHGFTKHIEDWPHCSYHAMLSEKETFLLRKDVIDWFGDKEAFIRLHKQSLQELEKQETKFT